MENRDFLESNEWKTLIKILRKGRENPEHKPLLWVGAGMSAAAGYPTTTGLISQLREYAPDEDLPPFENEDSFTQWIQQFAEKNGYGELAQAVAEIFIRRPPQEIHRNLVSLPWKAIFTTNYDELLEESLKEIDSPFLSISQKDNLGLKRNQLLLYKIHGSVSEKIYPRTGGKQLEPMGRGVFTGRSPTL